MFLSSVNCACHALSDKFLEENFSDQLFLHHLGSEDEYQSKSNATGDMLTDIVLPKVVCVSITISITITSSMLETLISAYSQIET